MLPISPSNLARRAACPGSAAMEKDAPQTTSANAERGRNLHKVMEDAVETGTSMTLERGHLPPEDEAAVRWCLDRITPHLRGADVILTEHKLDLTHLGMDRGGSPDLAAIYRATEYSGARIIFWDYKFGTGYVDAPKWNWQFRSYANGFWRAYGVNTITAIKLQPGAESPDHMETSYTWEAPELADIEARIVAIVAAAKDPNAPRNPGPHCRWCAAKDTCPSRQEAIMSLPTNVSVLDHMLSLEPKKRAALYEKLLIALEWAADAKKQIEASALNGGLHIPGWGEGTGRPTRGWKDDIAILPDLRRLAIDAGKNPDDLTETKTISPAQAEKLLGKKLFSQLQSQVETKPGEPKLVRRKD